MANDNKKVQDQGEQYQHIPTQSSDNNDDASEQQQQQQQGLLSKIGDPTGKVLGTALRPIGAPLEKGVTGPLGSALGGVTRGALGPLMGEEEERAEILGGKNEDSYAKEEKLGGKTQTGENPLGLDQSGRWGFEEEGTGGKGGHV